MISRRGLIIVLVAATVAVFAGLVWLIASLSLRNPLSSPSPSATVELSRAAQDCVYPLAYWMGHSELYPSEIVLGEVTFKADTLQGILSSENADLSDRLRAQLVGAFLNIQNGASQERVEANLYPAYAWVVEHPVGSQLADSDRQQGSQLLNALQAYNLGQAGVAACSGAPIASPGAATGTPNLPLTGTPSPSASASASATLTPATATATRTPQPPTSGPGIPTSTPFPRATNTPEKTTAVPPPTNTVPSPPTSTSTQSIPPTATTAPASTSTQSIPPTETTAPVPTEKPTLTPPVPTATNPPLP